MLLSQKLAVGIVAVACLLLARSATAVDYVDLHTDDKLPKEANAALFWKGDEQIGAFRNVHRLSPTRRIVADGTVLPLPRQEVDLGQVEISSAGKSMTIDDYMKSQRVGGLLVIKDGKIVYEKYALGNTEDTRWLSFSVSKSIVALLYGAAIKDGYISNVDEKVTDYLPRLRNSSYDQTTIKNLLQMSSGVTWDEDYTDPKSDVARAPYETLKLFEYLRHKPREAPPGEKFNYNTAETNLAGTLLRSAIGNNLSNYLTEKIWRPFGMESDAYWQLTESGGGEFGGCCISATLRDYGRLGLFALAQGKLNDGTAVLTENWMADSTAPSKGYSGYGYLWWLDGGSYEAFGIFGQGIYINPEQNIVIAVQSAREAASEDSDWALMKAMFAAIVGALNE